jgi:hypothetical protein
MRPLSAAEADQFALMLLSGAPVSDAIQYFCDPLTPEELQAEAIEQWPAQSDVLDALQRYTGGEAWHRMTDEQRLEVAIKKHYNEMSYFLWTVNYVEAAGADKLKADTCRVALETKLAGMAGQESPLARFYHDMLAKYDHQGAIS